MAPDDDGEDNNDDDNALHWNSFFFPGEFNWQCIKFIVVNSNLTYDFYASKTIEFYFITPECTSWS